MHYSDYVEHDFDALRDEAGRFSHRCRKAETDLHGFFTDEEKRVLRRAQDIGRDVRRLVSAAEGRLYARQDEEREARARAA